MNFERSSADPARWRTRDGLAAAFLFVASAAVVIWQNSRLGILWDLSYVLEQATRIALGDAPYRDFPFPYAPLTFLMQAALIDLGGRVYWHHIAYCAIVSGLATVFTWRIVLHILRGAFADAWWSALGLALPLIPLGIYSVYPHPFYDPDCSFVILLCILAWLRSEANYCESRMFGVGLLSVIPLFVKQNTGLAFLLCMLGSIGGLLLLDCYRKQSLRRYLILLAGVIAGLALALMLVHFYFGLPNYYHWTMQFAAQRRLPSIAEMMEIYRDGTAATDLFCSAIGFLLVKYSRRRTLTLDIASGLLLATPFVRAAFSLLFDNAATERAEKLLAIWPVIIIASFIGAWISLKQDGSAKLAIPFVLIGTVQGAFLSQQLWGSTYALWPLLVILIAGYVSALSGLNRGSLCSPERKSLALPSFTAAAAFSLTLAGASYVHSHERLDYVNLRDGDIQVSTEPALDGLKLRGRWLPDFDELVRYAEDRIPHDDGMLMIPGEDLFYFTTGRRPQFPVLMFDRTINPYSIAELVALARDKNTRWLITKNAMQLEEEAVQDFKDKLQDALRQDYQHIGSLTNYQIYRRRLPGDSAEDSR